MALVKTFEEILSWKQARALNKIIYLETNNSNFTKDYALKDQIRKSSISIMSNIAEGFERNNDREFRYFMKVAKGSAGELRTQLYIARDLEYIDDRIFNHCLYEVKEISKLIKGFIDSLTEKIHKELITKQKK